MRDIFYNTDHNIGSDHWLNLLNEAELSEWNWINSNMELVEKYVLEFELKDIGIHRGLISTIARGIDPTTGKVVK